MRRFTTTRLDLTENGQYTLTQGTKNIIHDLQEPISLKFFFSKKAAADYAQVTAYADQVRDLLDEYAALSGGKLTVQEINPEPFSEAEDQANANGLTAAPTQTGDPVYFGLVGTNTIGQHETIPFFAENREPYLEFDISTLIYHLSHPKKPKIGVISGLPLQAGPGGMMAMLQGKGRPYVLYQQLMQNYQLQTLQPTGAPIPADIDVLLVVDPQPLSDPVLYAIDQFVLRGGRALVMVDPKSEIAGASNQGLQRAANSSSNLPKLLPAWGVGYDPDKIIGDRDLATPVQVEDPRNPVQPYPIWLHLTADQFNHHDQVTANLQTINLAGAGALTQLKGATTNFAPLLSSSADAGLLDATPIRMGVTQPDQLMGQIVPTGHPFTIGARISGPAKTAFPKGAPPADPAARKPPQKAAPQVKDAKNINVIVLADSDVFDDRFWVRVQNMYGRQVGVPFSDNAAFVLNAVENLTGSSDLISLRTRATNARPFVVVQKLQQQAQMRFQQQAQGLQQKLSETQDRLKALQQGAAGQPGGAAGLTAEQQKEIQRFRREAIDTRAQLREVQRNLRKSIDELGDLLAFINIALVPLLVALFAIVLAALRRRRRARAIAF